MPREYIDIRTKGAVVRHLQELLDRGQVRPCQHICLNVGHTGNYYRPECVEDWAERIEATNVYTDITAHSGPSGYSWPSCPNDCPHFRQADDFAISASKTKLEKKLQRNEGQPEQNQVDRRSVAELPIQEDEQREPEPQSIVTPDKVTIDWLKAHVGMTQWSWVVGVIAAVFSAGVYLGQIEFVRELYGIDPTSENVLPKQEAVVGKERLPEPEPKPSQAQPVEAQGKLPQQDPTPDRPSGNSVADPSDTRGYREDLRGYREEESTPEP